MPPLGPGRGSDQDVELGGLAPGGALYPSPRGQALYLATGEHLLRSEASRSSLTPFAHSLAPLMSAS